MEQCDKFSQSISVELFRPFCSFSKYTDKCIICCLWSNSRLTSIKHSSHKGIMNLTFFNKGKRKTGGPHFKTNSPHGSVRLSKQPQLEMWTCCQIASFHIFSGVGGVTLTCVDAMGLLPIQDPQGCVWLSQNVPINLHSSFFALIGQAAPAAAKGGTLSDWAACRKAM